MIDIIFSILNLAIFIGIIAFLVKKALPNIRQIIDSENAVERDLHEEHHDVLAMQHRTEEDAKVQGEECERLVTKINQWKKTVEATHRVKESEAAFERHELAGKISKQSQEYNKDVLYQKLSPHVIAELEASLRTYYRDEKRAHAYVDRFIGGLRNEKIS